MADQWEDRNRGNDPARRGYSERERHERGMLDRGSDEVRSWLGDEDAARRRRMDELRGERGEREGFDRSVNTGERGWNRPRDQARDWTDLDRDGRRGMSEWRDSERPWDEGRGTPWSSDRDRDLRSRDVMASRVATHPAERHRTDDPGAATWNSPAPQAWPDVRYGSYAGRGPRGYQRSSERIREDVCDRLTDDPRVDASDIEVRVENGEVTLHGSVRTRDEKRFAEEVVERTSGVRDVNNHVKVKPADQVLGTSRSGASVLGLADTPPPDEPAGKSK